MTTLFTVRIRRNYSRPVRPEAEQVDGKCYLFEEGWTMDSQDPYPGEVAWIPCDPAYPRSAPTWIASGDLAALPPSPPAPLSPWASTLPVTSSPAPETP